MRDHISNLHKGSRGERQRAPELLAPIHLISARQLVLRLPRRGRPTSQRVMRRISWQGKETRYQGGRACWATKDRDVLLALSASRARGATRFLVRLNCSGRGAALPITPETPPRP